MSPSRYMRTEIVAVAAPGDEQEDVEGGYSLLPGEFGPELRCSVQPTRAGGMTIVQKLGADPSTVGDYVLLFGEDPGILEADQLIEVRVEGGKRLATPRALRSIGRADVRLGFYFASASERS